MMITFLGRLGYAVVLVCLITSFATAVAKDKDDDDNIAITTNQADLPRSAARQSSYPPPGTPEYPGLCPYRGHIGYYQCKEVTAIDHGKSVTGCPGKQLYLSGGNCYSCPDGYKRANITRKMAGDPKACTKRGWGKDPKPATYVREATIGCADGQFEYKGNCKTCPAHTRRDHFAMFDSGKCTVDKEYRCNAGLTLHKSAPKNKFDHFKNWIGLKYKKYCGEPFNLNTYSLEVMASEANKKLAEAIIRFGVKMAKDDPETRDKVARFKQAVKDHELRTAYDILQSFDEFIYLQDAASEGQQFAVSVGVGFDGSAGIGYSYEIGLAYEFGSRQLKWYQSHGLSKGISLSYDGAIGVGVWGGSFTTGYSQGYIVSADSYGFGVWSDYYTPKRADGLNQPHFIGLTGTFGGGAGAEIGEYNEVYTKVESL